MPQKKYSRYMRALDIQHIGNELAIKWEDGREDFISLETLRRACPCAGCKGETDILGNVYKNPPTPYAANAFQLVKVSQIGGYAISPLWADGHGSGIYSFDYLRRLAEVK
jgi:DUF971 family protein